MSSLKLTLKDAGKGTVICEAEVADTFWKRSIGLMFRKRIAEGSGLLIELPQGRKNCAIHTFFMRFPIDLVFLDPDRKVVDVKTLTQWRYYNPKKRCRWVLELLEGGAEKLGIKQGDELIFGNRR